ARRLRAIAESPPQPPLQRAGERLKVAVRVGGGAPRQGSPPLRGGEFASAAPAERVRHPEHRLATAYAEGLIIEVQLLVEVLVEVDAGGANLAADRVREARDVRRLAGRNPQHLVALPRVAVLPVVRRTLVAWARGEEVIPLELARPIDLLRCD